MTTSRSRPPTSGLKIDRENATFYGHRSQRKAAKRGIGLCIEGVYIHSWDELAERLGTNRNVAYDRYDAARRKAGPVTWAALARPYVQEK